MTEKQSDAIFWSCVLFVLTGIPALISYWLGPDHLDWWGLRHVFIGLCSLSVVLLILIVIKSWCRKRRLTKSKPTSP